ncbi:lysylphosphatidylglycerol synthase transmembrane domain-containing protein [Psychrobacter sp. I-STPA10]|uniref:lysylphosphatidylglycerol synthase transmembrane domain-containing protein n=1 Tax=Psychrobacter sp. I-STPA10 TaxID=2585769 RepID=UPI001E565BD3|nr:lysylphosphatidylglycerol synthase transmembrane domain-containing protein [Psychrobacter sp. I-STPA10]
MVNNIKPNYRKYISFLIYSIVIAFIGYMLLAFWSGWHDFIKVIEDIGFVGLIVALLLSLFNYILRFIRWQICLGVQGYKVPLINSLGIYLSGFALTTTPGKSGEAIRSYFLKKQYDVSYTNSLALLINERFYDFLAIFLLAIVGINLFVTYKYFIIFSFFFIVIFALFILKKGVLEFFLEFVCTYDNKVAFFLRRVLEIGISVRRINTVGVFSLNLVLSVLAWGSEAYALYFVLDLLSLSVKIDYAIFTYAISMLIGALSFLPGGLGSTEATMVTILTLNNINQPIAIAVTLFIRVVTLWFAVLIGILSLLIVFFKLSINKNESNIFLE